MSLIAGQSWFPVTGNIILKEGIPILSTPDDKIAYEVMTALTNHNKGMIYTCINSSGWYTKAETNAETELEKSLIETNERLREISEIYAGIEGSDPKTPIEKYQKWIIEQMYFAAIRKK